MWCRSWRDPIVTYFCSCYHHQSTTTTIIIIIIIIMPVCCWLFVGVNMEVLPVGYVVMYYILLQKLTSVSQWHFPRERDSEEAAAAGNGSRGRQRCWPRHHMGTRLVYFDVTGVSVVAPPGLVLHHPAAVQRLLQASRQLRGVATEGHPAAQDLRWKHDRNEAHVWMIEATRHECCMEITNINVSILPAQLAFLNEAHYFRYSVWTCINYHKFVMCYNSSCNGYRIYPFVHFRLLLAKNI